MVTPKAGYALRSRIIRMIESFIGGPLQDPSSHIPLEPRKPCRFSPTCYTWNFSPSYPCFPSAGVLRFNTVQVAACNEALDRGWLSLSCQKLCPFHLSIKVGNYTEVPAYSGNESENSDQRMEVEAGNPPILSNANAQNHNQGLPASNGVHVEPNNTHSSFGSEQEQSRTIPAVAHIQHEYEYIQNEADLDEEINAINEISAQLQSFREVFDKVIEQPFETRLSSALKKQKDSLNYIWKQRLQSDVSELQTDLERTKQQLDVEAADHARSLVRGSTLSEELKAAKEQLDAEAIAHSDTLAKVNKLTVELETLKKRFDTEHSVHMGAQGANVQLLKEAENQRQLLEEVMEAQQTLVEKSENLEMKIAEQEKLLKAERDAHLETRTELSGLLAQRILKKPTDTRNQSTAASKNVESGVAREEDRDVQVIKDITMDAFRQGFEAGGLNLFALAASDPEKLSNYSSDEAVKQYMDMKAKEEVALEKGRVEGRSMALKELSITPTEQVNSLIGDRAELQSSRKVREMKTIYQNWNTVPQQALPSFMLPKGHVPGDKTLYLLGKLSKEVSAEKATMLLTKVINQRCRSQQTHSRSRILTNADIKEAIKQEAANRARMASSKPTSQDSSQVTNSQSVPLSSQVDIPRNEDIDQATLEDVTPSMIRHDMEQALRDLEASQIRAELSRAIEDLVTPNEPTSANQAPNAQRSRRISRKYVLQESEDDEEYRPGSPILDEDPDPIILKRPRVTRRRAAVSNTNNIQSNIPVERSKSSTDSWFESARSKTPKMLSTDAMLKFLAQQEDRNVQEQLAREVDSSEPVELASRENGQDLNTAARDTGKRQRPLDDEPASSQTKRQAATSASNPSMGEETSRLQRISAVAHGDDNDSKVEEERDIYDIYDATPPPRKKPRQNAHLPRPTVTWGDLPPFGD